MKDILLSFLCKMRVLMYCIFGVLIISFLDTEVGSLVHTETLMFIMYLFLVYYVVKRYSTTFAEVKKAFIEFQQKYKLSFSTDRVDSKCSVCQMKRNEQSEKGITDSTFSQTTK